jgi:hypothetical protein
MPTSAHRTFYINRRFQLLQLQIASPAYNSQDWALDFNWTQQVSCAQVESQIRMRAPVLNIFFGIDQNFHLIFLIGDGGAPLVCLVGVQWFVVGLGI